MPSFSSPFEKRINIFFLITILAVVISLYSTEQNRHDYLQITGSIESSVKIRLQLDDIASLVQKRKLEEEKNNFVVSNGIENSAATINGIISDKIDSLRFLITGNSHYLNVLDTLSYYNVGLNDTNLILSTQQNRLVKYEVSESEKRNIAYSKMITLLDSINKEEETTLLGKIGELRSVKKESYLVAYIFIPAYLIFLLILFVGFKKEVRSKISTEIELKARLEKLESINRNRNKFNSIIAHDLRSPFQPILLIAKILKGETSPMSVQEINEFGEKLTNIGMNTLNLLDNLLAWSKIQTGRMQPQMESFLLREKVDYVLYYLKEDAEIKKINLLNEVEKDLFIYSDQEMFSSLLQNLISNAIKFTLSEGLVRIHAQKNGKNVLISVADNGIGIPPERLEKIFSYDTNFSTVGTHNEKGSGLGLLLCKEYVEIHKGRIWVESKPGDGTTFYFTIPLHNTHTRSFSLRARV